MQMVELTLTNAEASKIYIRHAAIDTVCCWNGKTEIQLQGGGEYTVRETVAEVLRQIPL